MRLFVAFEVAAQIRSDIARRIAAMRSELPSARWVAEENLHLTLCFLGNVDAERISELGRSLVRAFQGGRPMELGIESCGMFPVGGRPRVGWVGVRSSGDLAGLQGRVSSAALAAAGNPAEGREYHPHVTVVRPKRGWSADTRRRFQSAFEDLAGQWRVDCGQLMESRLESEGATYRVVEEFALTS